MGATYWLIAIFVGVVAILIILAWRLNEQIDASKAAAWEKAERESADFEKTSIVSLTQALRYGTKPVWVRLRELLAQRGLQPSTVALIDFFPDDVNLYFGVVAGPTAGFISSTTSSFGNPRAN